jgi:hypothetical protein
MKRIIIVVFAALVLCSSFHSAHAFGVMASWWQMDESSQDGFGFGLRERIQIVPLIGIDTRASWLNFSDQNDLNVFPLEAAGVVTLGLFYGGIGFGYYIFDAEDVELDNAFGWFVLAGVDVGLGGFGVFGDIQWRDLSADVEDVDPNLSNVPTSLDAAGVGFNVGINFGL